MPTSSQIFIQHFIATQIEALSTLDQDEIRTVVLALKDVQERGGRMFFIGSGGGAGHASHAAADFRRLLGIESYSVGDNVSELTALVNDESWEDSYRISLEQSRFSERDGIFVFSVGGGGEQPAVSLNLVNAMKLAHTAGATILGIVGSPGGFAAEAGSVVRVPIPDLGLRTPTAEGLQAVLWHLLVSAPELAIRTPHWENIEQLRG